MAVSKAISKRRRRKYNRARVRRFLFSIGPNRISRGHVHKRHLSREVLAREIEISSPRWPTEFNRLRIGHVSDFHLGELLPLEKALTVVEQLAHQEPDIIACTGDVVDLEHHHAGALFEALVNVGAPLGVFLVLGNHDELHCPETITQLATSAGIVVLRNQIVDINHNGGHLTLAGIHWAGSASDCAKHVDFTCDSSVDLLLSHNPKAFLRAADLEIPLTLAGHTHGGQIAMKNRPNANLAVSHRRSAGLFSEGPSRLFVTSGVGAWFPLRINCPAEIAMITMRRDGIEADTASESSSA